MLKVCDGCKNELDTDQDGSKWGCTRPIWLMEHTLVIVWNTPGSSAWPGISQYS